MNQVYGNNDFLTLRVSFLPSENPLLLSDTDSDDTVRELIRNIPRANKILDSLLRGRGGGEAPLM